MRFRLWVILLLFSVSVAGSSAQAPDATAVQPWSLSAFGGVDGTYTGIEGGKNLGVTAGIDLRVFTFGRYMLSGEVRGTEPLHDGRVDSQNDVLAGIKVDRVLFGRVNPYANILIGRGRIDYQSGGYAIPSQGLIYIGSNSTVISPGAGVDLDLEDHFAIKLDAQFQHWDTPVTTSGSVYAKALTAGIVYRFDFNHYPL